MPRCQRTVLSLGPSGAGAAHVSASYGTPSQELNQALIDSGPSIDWSSANKRLQYAEDKTHAVTNDKTKEH